MAYLYFTITYVNILILYHVGLVEIFRMIGHSLLSKNAKIIKIGFEWICGKNTFLGLLTSIIPKSTGFPLRTFFGEH